MTSGSAIWFDWAQYSSAYCSGDPGTWSWQNNSSDRVWKEQTYTGADDFTGYFYDTGGTESGELMVHPPER